MSFTYCNKEKTFKVFRRQHNSDNRVLIIFPHAGGATTLYRNWCPLAPNDYETWIALYPGKEDRFLDQPAQSIDNLATDAAEAFGSPRSKKDLVVFGHSMGAIVAFEFTRKLEENGLKPRLLVVSGRGSLISDTSSIRLDLQLNDYDFLTKINSDHMGIPALLLEDKELVGIAAHSLREDMQLIIKYNPTPKPIVNCDILCMTGSDESMEDTIEEYRWDNLTTMNTYNTVYDGGHFFIKNHSKEIMRLITSESISFSTAVSA